MPAGYTYIVGPNEETYKDYDDLPALAAGDSIWVKNDGGTPYADNWDLDAAVFVQVEPGTTFSGTFTQSAAKSGVLFGNGCTISGLYTISGADCWSKARNGLSTVGMSITGARAFHDGGGWGTLHDGGAARTGVNITGADVIVQNCRADTTPGSAGSLHGFALSEDRGTLRLCKVDDADRDGILVNTALDCLLEGCTVIDASVNAVRTIEGRTRMIGLHIAASDDKGIFLTNAANDSDIVAVGCVIQPCTGNELEIEASCDDNVVVANRVFGVIDDNSGTSTVQYNDLGTATVAVTGTMVSEQPSSLYESEIVAGGKTLIFTITNGSFLSLAAADLASAWRALITGNQDGNTVGWDDTGGKDVAMASGTVVLSSSNTVCTITLAAAGSYAIAATETLTIAALDKTVLASEVTITPDTTSLTVTEGTQP